MAALLNRNSKTFKDLRIAAESLTEEQILALLAANPKAMVRPLLTDGQGLVLGFAPEAYAAMLANV